MSKRKSFSFAFLNLQISNKSLVYVSLRSRTKVELNFQNRSNLSALVGNLIRNRVVAVRSASPSDTCLAFLLLVVFI